MKIKGLCVSMMTYDLMKKNIFCGSYVLKRNVYNVNLIKTPIGNL